MRVRLPLTSSEPLTPKVVTGLAVPIPTFPFAKTVKKEVPEDDATLKGFKVPVPWTLKETVAEVALTPTTVALLRKSAAEVMFEPEVK